MSGTVGRTPCHVNFMVGAVVRKLAKVDGAPEGVISNVRSHLTQAARGGVLLKPLLASLVPLLSVLLLLPHLSSHHQLSLLIEL